MRLNEAQDAETERLRAEERLSRARGAWDAWSAWWSRRARELATAAKVLTLAGGIVAAIKAVLWRESPRDVGRAELPANGVASTALDTVDKRPPHDAGK